MIRMIRNMFWSCIICAARKKSWMDHNFHLTPHRVSLQVKNLSGGFKDFKYDMDMDMDMSDMDMDTDMDMVDMKMVDMDWT